MKIVAADLNGVVVIEPRVFGDGRGFLLESYHAERYADAGLPQVFVQDNHSCSAAGTIRGLHYQLRHPQAKLIRVIRGAVYDVAMDIRRRSPTFARWVAVDLSAENKRQLFIPTGFAHGFCALADGAEIEYKCSEYYDPDDQRGVAWNDAGLAIPWPTSRPILSDRDHAYLPLTLNRSDLPDYRAGST